MFRNSSEVKNIIIVGCGRLGAHIANMMYDKGLDVTIIDKDSDAFRKLSLSFGGEIIEGDALDLDIYDELKISPDDVFIIVTNKDNTNIMVSQLLKDMYHVKNIVCRIYDIDRSCVYEELGIQTICPTQLASKKIEELI